MTRWASRETIDAAMSGDSAALERLLTAIWPACFRLAASVTGDRSLAQDAAQEACVAVHRKIAGLRSAGAFDTWMYRIVMHEAARLRRRHGDSVPFARDRGFDSDSSASLDVWRALAGLSAPLRDVTVLFYFDDLKTEEIAAILRIPHATVRTRLARARERLRVLLGDYEFEVRGARSEVTGHAC